MTARKSHRECWPWLVIRTLGVDEYESEADARADANGGAVVRASEAAAAPALLAALRATGVADGECWCADAREGCPTATCDRCVARAALALAEGTHNA